MPARCGGFSVEVRGRPYPIGVFPPRFRKEAVRYAEVSRARLYRLNRAFYKEALGRFRRGVFERFEYRCARCSRQVTWDSGELNEKVPRGAGGHRTSENCNVLCRGCHEWYHSAAGEVARKEAERCFAELLALTQG